ncbi:MAG: DUF367 family protein [Thermoplasmata archaeon]|jgi:pre-rRNA-processing protein TSR3
MIKIYIIDLEQDDPRKCTAHRLAKFGYARLVKNVKHVNGILLSPFTDKIFSYSDLKDVLNHGIYAVDGSWKNGEKIFERISGKYRRLPYLVPGNNINFGKPYMLSTAEAISSALYILGYKDIAEKIMGLFSWGHTFLEMNKEPLDDYFMKSEEDIKKIEKLYIS